MLQTMFVELDLPQKFNIPLPILRNFLYEVYNNYNEVPFHNFRHCFCVAQMVSIRDRTLASNCDAFRFNERLVSILAMV